MACARQLLCMDYADQVLCMGDVPLLCALCGGSKVPLAPSSSTAAGRLIMPQYPSSRTHPAQGLFVSLQVGITTPCTGHQAATRALHACVQGGWQNRALVRMAAEFTTYNPIRSVPRVAAPVLLVAATNDSLCPYELVERAAALNPKVPPCLPLVPCPAASAGQAKLQEPWKAHRVPTTNQAYVQAPAYATQRLCKVAKLPEAGSVTRMCVQVQVVSRGVGHFDVYMGAAFDDVVEEQLAFLQVRNRIPCPAQHCCRRHHSDHTTERKEVHLGQVQHALAWCPCTPEGVQTRSH